MLRSLYIASTGMLDNRKKMNVMTNNISNLETVGFKKDTYVSRSFKDMLIKEVGKNGKSSNKSIGNLNTGVHTDEVVTCFDQGNIEGTGRLLDFAIQGSGFFAVSTPQGERYTRDGCFSVNQNGYLVNNDGYYVTGQNGRIYVGEAEFSVDEAGGVFIDEEQVDQFKIMSFADQSSLRKEGDNLYMSTAAGTVSSEGSIVRQGCKETSNVNMTQEVVDIMKVSRSYETNQRIVKMLDETLSKTVNEVGRV